MMKRVFLVFSILPFLALIWTTNSSFAGGGGGCGDDTGCNNAMIGIAVAGVVLLGIAFLYTYYSGQKAKDQSSIHDSSLPILNFVGGNQTLEAETQLSPNDSEQRIMEGGKFALLRW